MKPLKFHLSLVALLLTGAALHAAPTLGFDFDPFYERVKATNDMEFLAVRPFYSKVDDPAEERWVKDYLWPLYSRKGYKGEVYSRFLFFGWSLNFSPETERRRVWVLPFYFKGVNDQDESYFALFPFGGNIYEFLGRDKVKFVLFPIYSTSSVNEVYTKSVVWPIYSKTEGPGVHRFRVWPIYGTSTREDEFNKKFVLWPFWNSVEYTNERNPGGGFILFPIYGRVLTEKSKTYWYIPPFGRYSDSERQRTIHAPWPFVQIADGEMYKRVFWPIYGKRETGPITTRFALWPILWNNETRKVDYTQHRRYVAPFFIYQTDVMNKDAAGCKEGEVASRYWKLWPLMSWERQDGNTRFRTLDLWPMRDTPGIERNWAPIWTLYRRMDTNGEIGHHVLWGLYRQTRSTDGYEWSLLKGLAGYKKKNGESKVRFLFLWFGGNDDAEEQL